MSTEFKRILIDSRHRDPESRSNADFWVTIPYPVSIPAGSTLYVDSVLLSHSWFNVDTNSNQNLYVKETVAGVDHPRIVSLDIGSYTINTLATELALKLNTGKFLSGTYSVTVDDGRLVIANTTPAANGSAIIYSDDEIHDRVTFPSSANFVQEFGQALFYPLRSANELIGHLDVNSYLINASQSLTTSYVDLQPHKRLLLACPGLGESTYVSLTGDTDVIRSILVGSSLTGDVVQDSLNHTTTGIEFKHDAVIQKLHFLLRSSNTGQALALKGHQISFELVISRPD